MSVINKMLQDLDRRQALGAAAETNPVRVSTTKAGGHEWFWRILVVLLTAALAWMGWVAVQLLPRKPLVTELAFQAAAEAQSRPGAAPAAAPAPVPAPAPVAVRPEPQAVAEEPKPAPAAAPVVSDSLRLALELQTPIKEAAPAKADPPKPAALPKKEREKVAPTTPTASSAPSVDKRDRARTGHEGAEAHFRRAVLLLNSGRVAEAEDQLGAALRMDPAHAAARQAYVALLLEQRRLDTAQRQLQQALALNSEQPTFALALARLHVAQREYAAALDVLERAGPAPGNPDFQAMRGAVLQRLGRHAEAVDAYQAALRTGSTQPATSWIGLAISLESLGRRAEAAGAYRRALSAGPIAQEAREYAESRARALE